MREVASYLAPMPGGVGPMTRAMLLANVVDAAEAARAASGSETGAPDAPAVPVGVAADAH